MNVPLRAAIVGAGQISKMHVAALDDTPHAELVAVVDRDLGLAGALAAGRPGVGVYSSLSELLADRAVDAVHVATPPTSHAALAIEAMEAGCHALVEKPMCLSGDEADKMLAAARANGVVLSTCHNYQFKPSVVEARRLVREGAIGKVTSVAAVYGVAGEKSSYAGGGPGAHWAWRLPGGVFTNFLPHLIALEQEFLGDDTQVVGVSLTHRGRDETPTELVAVLEGPEASATMTVSLRTKPYVKYLEVFGTRGIVRADLVREVCTISRNRPMPGALSKVVFNAEHVLQVSTGTVRAAAMVALGRWKAMPGLRVLVDDFYGSIAAGRSPEITGEDGRRMVAVLDTEISTRTSRDGERFSMTVQGPEEYRDARIDGVIQRITPYGNGRSAEMRVDFDTIRLPNGQTAEFDGVLTTVRTPGGVMLRVNSENVPTANRTGQTVQSGAVGAALGAIIGAIAGGGKGAAIGAVVGGAGGVILAQNNDQHLDLPPGTQVTLVVTSSRFRTP